MARQEINKGAHPNTPGNDTLSSMVDKINSMTDELYENLGVSNKGIEPFGTKAAMDAVTPVSEDPQVALVAKDSTAANNGFYHWDGSAWVLSDLTAQDLDPADSARWITGQAVANYPFPKKINYAQKKLIGLTTQSGSGELTSALDYHTTDFITVTTGETVYITATSSNPIIAYDANKDYHSELYSPTTSREELSDEEITIPAGVNYIRITSAFRNLVASTGNTSYAIMLREYANDNAVKKIKDESYELSKEYEFESVTLDFLPQKTTLVGENGHITQANDNDGLSQLIEVEGVVRITTSLWKSSNSDFSDAIFGYSDKEGSAPTIIRSANNFSGENGTAVSLDNYEIIVPNGVKYIRIPNRDHATPAVEVQKSIFLRQSQLQTKKTRQEIADYDYINDITIINGREIRANNPDPDIAIVDSQITDYIPVVSGNNYYVTARLFKSTISDNSTAIVGYTPAPGRDQVVIYNANDSSVEAGNYVNLIDHKITIPPNITDVRISHKTGSGLKIKLYPALNVHTQVDKIDLTLSKYRGEQAVNNLYRASLATDNRPPHHDSQIIVMGVDNDLRVYIIYRSPENYTINCRDPFTNELYYSHDLVTTGEQTWAPRMYEKDSTTLRLVYTKNRTAVFYKDLDLTTGTLGTENTFKVAIKDGSGNHDTPQDFVLDRFLQHCANVTGIDYRDVAYDSFSSRNLLVEDTQQIQEVGGVYYLTSQVLADGTPHGDTGGIACLMYSNDLDNWYLMNPIKVTTTINDQRDHEVSATYLNGKWHALTRWNNNTFDGTSGYNYYTSPDGNTWTEHGILSELPEAMNGIRHGVWKYNLRYANPEGSNYNKWAYNKPAFIVYQRTPRVHNINEGPGSHQLRSRLGVVYTYDFKNFVEVADIVSRNNNHYPSICIYNDFLYLSWTTGQFVNSSYYTGSIGWTKINISNV